MVQYQKKLRINSSQDQMCYTKNPGVEYANRFMFLAYFDNFEIIFSFFNTKSKHFNLLKLFEHNRFKSQMFVFLEPTSITTMKYLCKENLLNIKHGLNCTVGALTPSDFLNRFVSYDVNNTNVLVAQKNNLKILLESSIFKIINILKNKYISPNSFEDSG